MAIPQFLTGLLCYLECLLIGTTICGVKAARHVPAYDKDYVIILGCAIAKEGQPLPLLRGRIDRALEFAKKTAQRYRQENKICYLRRKGKR